ncbi:MAG: glycosyltransferase [Patescibacteria group bacterium]
MRITYIANARIPTEKAHGIQIIKMCEAFTNLGHRVELVIPKRKNPIQEEIFSYYGVKNSFVITRLWCIDTVKFGFWGFLLEWLSFAEMAFWYLLFKKNDIYFGRDYVTLLYLSLFRRKTVWETHTGEWNILIWLFSKLDNKVVAISQGLKDFYVKKGVKEEKIVVAHDAVDLEQFTVSIKKDVAREKHGLQSELPLALYAGKLDGWKGVETLLLASQLLIGEVKMVIIGGSEEEIVTLKKKYPEVTFLGYHPYRQLPEIQQMADVLVIPNTSKNIVSRQFTSPLKVFAAMASGIPMVVSDLPSVREILDDSMCYFFSPDNAENLANVIKMVLTDGMNSQVKTEKALLKAEIYTWEKRAANILNFMSKDNSN